MVATPPVFREYATLPIPAMLGDPDAPFSIFSLHATVQKDSAGLDTSFKNPLSAGRSGAGRVEILDPYDPNVVGGPSSVKRSALILCTLALCAANLLFAQSESSSATDAPAEMASAQASPAVQNSPYTSVAPFSRMALGVGISPLGVSMEAATDINAHMNLRFTGNLFSYSTSFTTSGIPANADLNLASAGASLDVYPFHSGFRISPGVLFLNQNELTATANMPGGTSFTLNDQTYYSASANSVTGATPLTGNGSLTLNNTKPAFTITAGWGNHIQRHGHWSVPFEIGIATIGAPRVNMVLNGWACTDASQLYCTNINNPTNPIAIQIQQNLQTQIAKWNSDIEPLKTYPIVKVGVAYSFRIRKD